MDWLFPPQCVGCGRVGARFCDDCIAYAPKPTPPLCAICGAPLSAGAVRLEDGREVCPTCAAHPPAFHAARSWAVMTGSVRKAVHAIKYRRDLGLAHVLAAQLIALVEREAWEIEVVLPIPLGEKRHKERGYNQAALLAFPLALGLGAAYAPHTLKRVRETRSQVGLSAEERRRNVAGAFAVVDGERIAGKTVLLVDDVMTTGATLSAAASALLAAGARDVYAVTVARAVLRHSPIVP